MVEIWSALGLEEAAYSEIKWDTISKRPNAEHCLTVIGIVN